MSLAELRAPRKTAGNRMSGLLGREEEDEFYKTTYGGFNEVRGEGHCIMCWWLYRSLWGIGGRYVSSGNLS